MDGQVRLTLDLTYEQLYRLLDALGIKRADDALKGAGAAITVTGSAADDDKGTQSSPLGPDVDFGPDNPGLPPTPWLGTETESAGDLPASPSVPVTFSELRDLAAKLSQVRGKNALKALFTSYSIRKLSDLQEANYAAFKEELISILNF